MLKYFLQRILAAIVTLFIILTLAFTVVRLMPGSIYDDANLPADVISLLEARAHLNEPVLVQYGYFLSGVILHNDWGTSVRVEPGLPAFKVLADKIPVSISVNIWALIIAIPVGVMAGTLAALKKNKRADAVISFGVIIGISVPSFVFASLLQYVFGYKLGLFPILFEPTAVFGVRVHSLILPILALSLGPIATITRYVRGELIEVLNSEYLVLAKTKGLTQSMAIKRHAFRNAALPLTNVIIPMFSSILGGSMVVERIFSIPGVGGTMIKAINSNDYSLAVATLIFYALISIVTVLVVDFSYGLIDPRIRVGGIKE